MSELINTKARKYHSRWQLLTTASGAALIASLYGSVASQAADQDADRPTVWIELGTQLEHINGQGDSFPVGFASVYPDSIVLQPTTPIQAQRPVPFGFAEEGKISLQPAASDWVFTAAINYGRSSNLREVDQQTNKTFFITSKYGVPQKSGNPRGIDKFSDTQSRHQESHTILDFSAGRDFGLGMFGKNASSVMSLGVRIAQFSSQTKLDIRARPDLEFYDFSIPSQHAVLHLPYFHTYHLTGQAARTFRGVGPSLSWAASAPVAGGPQDGEVSLDWGINAAVLFGRQKAHVGHHETGRYVKFGFVLNGQYYTAYQRAGGHDTDRSAVIPNVGAFVGATYRIEDFKVSMGYRADFFVGAVDGGIDSRKSETLGFYGPFASVSVGLGR